MFKTLLRWSELLSFERAVGQWFHQAIMQQQQQNQRWLCQKCGKWNKSQIDSNWKPPKQLLDHISNTDKAQGWHIICTVMWKGASPSSTFLHVLLFHLLHPPCSPFAPRWSRRKEQALRARTWQPALLPPTILWPSRHLLHRQTLRSVSGWYWISAGIGSSIGNLYFPILAITGELFRCASISWIGHDTDGGRQFFVRYQ